MARHGAYAALRIAIGAQPRTPVLGRHGRRTGRRPEPLGTARSTTLTRRRTWPLSNAWAAGFLIPEDEHWPEGLDDLPDAPSGLWYRGNLDNGIPAPSRCAALTGSRDRTSYGAAVTGDIAYGLAQRGICVISGLGYGIDAHAHRAALAGSQSVTARRPSPFWLEDLTGTTRQGTRTSPPRSAPTD